MIPISVFVIIDPGTASSSPFQPTPKNVHDHVGIMFIFRWNPRSPCSGNRDHDRTGLCTKSSPKSSPRSGRVQEDIFSNKTGVMYTSPRDASCSVVAPEKVANRRCYWRPSQNASDVPFPSHAILKAQRAAKRRWIGPRSTAASIPGHSPAAYPQPPSGGTIHPGKPRPPRMGFR